ncbi:MAG: hypothetical protein H7287_01660 [Thermoleophilia bacterium]|nr:hypothetical protein [Thermoleophilia bacterium]
MKHVFEVLRESGKGTDNGENDMSAITNGAPWIRFAAEKLVPAVFPLAASKLADAREAIPFRQMDTEDLTIPHLGSAVKSAADSVREAIAALPQRPSWSEQGVRQTMQSALDSLNKVAELTPRGESVSWANGNTVADTGSRIESIVRKLAQ